MSPRRRLVVIVMVIALVGIAVGVAVGRVFSDESEVARDRPGPVLLVPGYGGGTRSLEDLAAMLRVDGRDAAVVPPVGDGTGDLRDQVAALDRAAADRLGAGADSVDVVGFSAGGIVVRLWAEESGGAEVARRIVTLGSPHHGAELAQLGALFGSDVCPEACQQLAPGSDLLAALGPAPSGPRWTAVWTSDDTVVTPPESGRLEGAVNVRVQDICRDADVGHGQLPTDPLVVAVVVRALGTSPLEEPPAATRCDDLRETGRALAGTR